MITQASPSFTDIAKSNLVEAIDSNWITEGKFCNDALRIFRERTKLKHAFFAPNGTLAIYLALLALDLPRGSKVIVPSFTFYGSVTPLIFAGLKPTFVDCDEQTYQADVSQIEAAIDNTTSAVMAVDIYGRMCDIAAIRKICDKHSIRLIEDAAQAVGVYDNDKNHAGKHADISTFSLFADKSFSSGEGGIVATNCDNLAEKIKLIRNQGRPNSGTFIHPSLGMNFRVTDLHGGLAIDQFMRWDSIRKQRQDKWIKWADALSNCGSITVQNIGILDNAVPFRFAFTSERSQEISNILEQNNMMVRGFFYPMHLQPQLKIYHRLDCGVSEKISSSGLCLPLHELVTDEVITIIAEEIKKVG